MNVQELHLSSVAGNKYGTVKRKTSSTYYCGKLLWCENYPYTIQYLLLASANHASTVLCVPAGS